MPNEEPITPEAQVDIDVEPLAEFLPPVVDWLPESLIPVWEIIDRIPLVGALVIALSFFVLAVLIRVVVFRSLRRLAGLSASLVDDRILQDLRKPVFTTILFIGLSFATNVAMLPIGTSVIVNSLLSVIVASWMRAILRISDSLLDTLGNHEHFTLIETRTIPLFDLSTKLLTILFGSYVLLLIWGINPVGWLASAGIVGIAVGFAAKDTLANLFSGFFIVADAPYKIGDYINLDSGERGRVSAIGLRSTRLLTRDDVEITIPNGVIANAKIINESGGPHLKIRTAVPVGVAYGSDVDQVMRILGEIGLAHPETCANPEPRVRLRGFGSSSLDFDLLIWIDHPEQRGGIKHELLIEIYKAFDREGIEIPYSKHDVYIKETPASAPEPSAPDE